MFLHYAVIYMKLYALECPKICCSNAIKYIAVR